MKNCSYPGLLLLLLFFNTVLLASGGADSLIRYAERPGLHDTIRLRAYGDISWELMGSDIGRSQLYAEKELALARSLSRDADIAQAESDLGNVFNRKGLYDSALVHYQKALDIRKTLNHVEKMAGIYTNIATVLMRQNKFREALDINFRTLRIFEQTGDLAKQSNVLGNIGNIYYELDQSKSAEEFLRRGLHLARKAAAPIPQANILVNIGGIKFEQNALDSALYYFLEAEKIMIAHDLPYNLAAVYNNIGKIHQARNENALAVEYYGKALDNRVKLNDTYGIGLSRMNLGEALMRTDAVRSLQELNRAAEIFAGLRSYINLKQVYSYMAQLYEMRGDFAQANHYFKLYAAYKDSVYTDENARAMAELQTRFESEKKDLEIARKNAEITLSRAEIDKKNILTSVLLAAILLLILVAWLFYTRHQMRQKAAMDAELLRQQELRSRAIIEAEEKERLRIARDLHDGIGQTLSAARVNLSSLQERIAAQDTTASTLFRNAMELVDESVREVRSVSHSMMPNALLKTGLAAAVREFIQKLSSAGKFAIDLEIDGLDDRLEQSTETVLFRVLQELVSNIVRHAQASRVGIQLFRDEAHIVLIVEDDGKGFDAHDPGTMGGIGLRNIQSRVAYLKGSVHFDSTPGRGTTVTVEIPYSV